MTKDTKPKESAAVKRDLSMSTWALEDAFPEVNSLLKSSVISPLDGNELIVLDTNVLLLPYVLGGKPFGAIKSAFVKLAKEKRLIVPGRVVREFLSNRDRKIADILKDVEAKANGAHNAMIRLPDFFNDLEEAKPAFESKEELRKASDKYAESLRSLVKIMAAWCGDDPVSAAYRDIFTGDVLFDPELNRSEIETSWKKRLASRIPPGYKDAGKPDAGIGDFLIWSCILEIGRMKNQNLIFITGDEKADWRVRSNGKAIYLRPELIDEYRRESKGRSIELLSLAGLLTRVGAEDDVVVAVSNAEESASAVDTLMLDYQEGIVNFDYSTSNGELIIPAGEKGDFTLKFSKASDEFIHVYAVPGGKVARVKHVSRDQAVLFESYDSSSRVYTVGGSEIFLVKNRNGSVLAAKIMGIQDDTRGSEADSVTFIYRTFAPGVTVRVP